jgi:hypothetical protein
MIVAILIIWGTFGGLFVAACFRETKEFFSERPTTWGHIVVFLFLLPGLILMAIALVFLAMMDIAFEWLFSKPVKK